MIRDFRLNTLFKNIVNKLTNNKHSSYEDWINKYNKLSDNFKENLIISIYNFQTKDIRNNCKNKEDSYLINLGVFKIKTTRDIGRQILRHRSFSFQEFSQRYAEVDISMFEDRECRIQDTKNRQSSYPTKNEHLLNSWQHNIDNVKKACGDVYKLFMNLGFAKEQARAVLPEGLTPSTMYMKGSIRSWFHFCLVRCHPGTQKEHRDIADAVWVVMQEKFEFFRELDMQKLSIRYQEVFEEILKECTNEL